MGIVKYALIEMECEICGEVDRADYWKSASMARYAKQMRGLGWSISKDYRRCICPECRKKKKN